MAKVYAGWPYNVCQIGTESTPGTPVAATTIWRGPFGSPEDDRNRQMAEENVGLLVPTERSYDTSYGINIGQPATELTYEQVIQIFEAGIKNATATGTNPYTRVYSFPTGTSVNTIKAKTFEMGNILVSTDFKRIPYCFVTEFELSGKSDEAWKMSSTWRGQQMSTFAFTTSIALPSVEIASFNNTKLYIDASGGTLGATQKLGVLMEASIKVKTGIVPVPVGDGSLVYTAHKFVQPEVTYSLTYELEQDTGVSTVATERAAFEANNFRLFRLQVPGTSSRDIKMDFAGKYTKVGGYNKEGDGNTTVQFEGKAWYSSTDALFCNFTVVNALASVP